MGKFLVGGEMGLNPSPALTSWATRDESLSLSELPVSHLLDKENNHLHLLLCCHEDRRNF